MSLLVDAPDRPVDFVLHPTDLSEASLVAFHHALAIAIRCSAQLTLLHAVGRRQTDSWLGFPSVRDTLARWRSAGSTRGIEDRIRRSSVTKLEVPIPDPVAACHDYLARNSVNLIVLATEGRRGLSRLLGAPRAERLARESGLTTIFVPSGARPFVAGDTGDVTLTRILVPVSPETDAHPAMLFAVRSAALLDDPALEITLLHVGDGDDSAARAIPDLPYCKWSALRRTGEPAAQILAVAEEVEADAICMATSWNPSRLRRRDYGVTERVLQGATCPVAAIPVAAR